MIDLWPDDITTHTGLKAPVTILKEQGTLLGRKTSNIVEGMILKSPIDTKDFFEYDFYLVAPALGDYRYQLLRIKHSVDLYPLSIYIGGDVFEELSAEVKGQAAATAGEYQHALKADSEDRFMEILRAIFATQKVRRVIEAIIAQSGVGVESA